MTSPLTSADFGGCILRLQSAFSLPTQAARPCSHAANSRLRPSGARSCPRPTKVAHLPVELPPGRSHHSPAIEASREAIDHRPVSEGIGFGVAGVLRLLMVSLPFPLSRLTRCAHQCTNSLCTSLLPRRILTIHLTDFPLPSPCPPPSSTSLDTLLAIAHAQFPP